MFRKNNSYGWALSQKLQLDGFEIEKKDLI